LVVNLSAARVTVRDGYGKYSRTVAPGEEFVQTLDLGATANWYDFLVEGPGGFVRHLAGHVEDGKPSLSDPLLGMLQ
jgi:phospholipase C